MDNKLIIGGMAAWAVRAELDNAIKALDPKEDKERITELRDFKREIIDFEERIRLPELRFVNLEIQQHFSDASNNLPASWKRINQSRDPKNPYVEVLLVRPVTTDSTIVPYLQRGTTQFPITKKRVDAMARDFSDVILIAGEMYRFQVELWQKGKTQYVNVAEGVELETIDELMAMDLNDLFEIGTHSRNGMSFQAVENLNLELLQTAANADNARAQSMEAEVSVGMATLKQSIIHKVSTQGIDSLSANELALIS